MARLGFCWPHKDFTWPLWCHVNTLHTHAFHHGFAHCIGTKSHIVPYIRQSSPAFSYRPHNSCPKGMPPHKKTNVITLPIESGYALPDWYASASNKEISASNIHIHIRGARMQTGHSTAGAPHSRCHRISKVTHTVTAPPQV